MPVTTAYLGLSKLSFPLLLEVRGGSTVLLREEYDLKTFWQVFLHRCYRVLATDKKIIDAGANIVFLPSSLPGAHQPRTSQPLNLFQQPTAG